MYIIYKIWYIIIYDTYLKYIPRKPNSEECATCHFPPYSLCPAQAGFTQRF